MYPDTPYAGGRGSFLRPVPLPHYGPSAEPTKTIVVACEWLPYIRGALQQLLLQSTWATDNPAFLTDIQGNVFNLIDLFQECASEDLPYTCDYDFLLSDGAWATLPRGGTTPGFLGEYVAGGGWFQTIDTTIVGGSDVQGIIIVKRFTPEVLVSHADVTYDLVKGGFDTGGYTNVIVGYNATSQVFATSVDALTDPDGSGKVLAWSGAPVSTAAIVINIITGQNNSGTDPGGQANVYRASASGVGTATC